MKTAIPLPDDVVVEAESLASQTRISRSELQGRALEEFLARHAPDRMTQALDTLCDSVDTRPDGFAAARYLEVWWANLSDLIGPDPGHRRPVVIVQCDAFGRITQPQPRRPSRPAGLSSSFPGATPHPVQD
jgi:hypothetical protein